MKTAPRRRSQVGEGEPIALELVIAEHTYRVGRQRVVARIGQPRPEDGHWYCPYQITGVGDEKVRRVWGVDSFQALQLVMQVVRAHLLVHADMLSLHGEKGLIGISKLMPDFFPTEVNAKFENGVESALELLAAYGEAMQRTRRRRKATSSRGRR